MEDDGSEKKPFIFWCRSEQVAQPRCVWKVNEGEAEAVVVCLGASGADIASAE